MKVVTAMNSYAPRNFATAAKSAPSYLDVAANAHGAEKGHLMRQALDRLGGTRRQVVEVGPGGGAAVAWLAATLADQPADTPRVELTLVEAPGVTSASLVQAMEKFGQVGACRLVTGLATELDAVLPGPVDVISASALLHEVYSYSGGYPGLYSLIRALPAMLTSGGFFAYRDVYAVNASCLHQRVTHSYDIPSWLRFLRLFLPRYLSEGRHPYHRADDQILVRQNSRPITIPELDTSTCALVTAPIGLLRETQRHYLTARDHVWRSGALGFTPILDGQLAADWIDFGAGHKRVHYALTDLDWLPLSQKAMLRSISEPYADHLTVDGDLFDEVTDVVLDAFLNAVERGDRACAEVWSAWMSREGHETYTYFSLDELLTAFTVLSAEAQAETVLMPIQSSDIERRERHHYNRFLSRRLISPLLDAKQLVLFANVPRADTTTLRQALATVRPWCSKPNLARIHTAVCTRG
ncbi:class I SAM-dependent methyltransferase [Streptoalloteichus hindustanus]|uniref:Methyltransferase domain-containing protein n=1 Tax=Streptoalloteichus hindustanus TaxID=2017 RepID=A0A1M5DED0_STRHI|nr:hypothetical protein [Streptoalloteichus hindustanus]SHF65286.1 hypothetical protein SAMN05444320_104419 [Streptoalloteichus hindustanus]